MRCNPSNADTACGPPSKGDEQREFDTARRVEYGRDNLKQQMKSTVWLLAEQYRFGSITEFRTLLNLYNVDLEERKGEADGKRWNGIVYTATDEQGKWVGTPIKSSALTPKGGYKFLQKQIARNDADIKSEQIKGPIRGTVARAMHRARTQRRVRAPAESRRHRRRFSAKRRRPYHGRDVRRPPDENRAERLPAR